jgi:hypothetical protein
LRKDLGQAFGDGPPGSTLCFAWEQLKEQARTDKSARQAHLDGMQERHGRSTKKTWALGLLLVSTIGFAVVLVTGTRSQMLAGSATEITRSNVPLNTYSIRAPVLPKPAKPREIRVIGYREEWVPGRPMEQCVGADRELNMNVLRCREGYKLRVPVFNQ